MPGKLQKILVPINGSKAGAEAFRLACEIVKFNKARVRALYVIEVGQDFPLDADVDSSHGEAVLSEIEAVAEEEKCRVEAEYLQARHAGPAIVQEALERQYGMIVMGIPYKGRLGHFTLGNTSSHVLKNALCPVIIVREQPADRNHD